MEIRGPMASAYFCHVRFLWRFAFKRFRRLCLFIFSRRFFFRLPMVGSCRVVATVRLTSSPVKTNLLGGTKHSGRCRLPASGMHGLRVVRQPCQDGPSFGDTE